ncbi:expressed unknown protein [Seminavis robusta]|uniref:Uncharacterized protein n=1 Tax=Seminavis robusta TaxID=568900 RepID=A0A9N8DGP8_9STRA|nr:expressed unknown protein [Seminavis robusta]|eukprot:Sro79_g042600.1 n/a (517) ;mRNA; f:4486-6144
MLLLPKFIPLALAALLLPNTTAFNLPASSKLSSAPRLSINSRLLPSLHSTNTKSSSRLHLSSGSTEQTERQLQLLDYNLENGKLGDAIQLLQSNPDLVSFDGADGQKRWNAIFDTIEEQTALAEETVEQVNTRRMAEFPTTSTARTEMTQMYQTLKDIGQLRVFGAVPSRMPPAAGSHAVRPSMLEEITDLPMKALTPQPSNTLLYAGVAVALLEGVLSVATGINLNLLVFATLTAFGIDRILLNGAILESAYKILNPDVQNKIQRHEAGHFLCAYLLGCPVEGCVLDAWAALQDARFGTGRQVTAGTSFFDPVLSQQINERGGQVTRSSVDRYSIIVMAGIAAEAIHYGQADGGAGDEMALIAFLSQMNANVGSGAATWNNVSIRNQARWGALQSVLILREYKACYEALVQALDNGGSLGECIYAIEKAARDNQLGPLKEPLGYIVELAGDEEQWVTEPPEGSETASAAVMKETASVAAQPVNGKESLAKLNEYRKEVEEKLKSIDEKLHGISKD